MWASSLCKDLVLLLLRSLLYGVGVVVEDCLVCCRLWRFAGAVFFCFLAMCGSRAIRDGGFSDLS